MQNIIASKILSSNGLRDAVMDPAVVRRIPKYLKDHGISNYFIARKTQNTAQKIGRVISGKSELRIRDYEDICDALGVPYEYFLKD